jgi:transposase
MPRTHREYAGWTPQRLVRWAEKSGPATAQLVTTILAARAHPQQGYRSCLGVMRLGKAYGDARLEAACRRALALGATSFKSVQSILKRNLDQQPLPSTEASQTAEPITHANIRGSKYYH